MEKTKPRRFSAKAWRALLARFEQSGLTAIAFCEREGVSSKRSYRWRTRLGAAGKAATRTVACEASPAPGFIDLGALRGGNSPGVAPRPRRRSTAASGPRVMFFPEGRIRMFQYGQPTDMRKSFDGI